MVTTAPAVSATPHRGWVIVLTRAACDGRGNGEYGAYVCRPNGDARRDLALVAGHPRPVIEEAERLIDRRMD